MNRISKSRPLGHAWFTDSGRGTAARKPEDQCESSSSTHPSIVVYMPARPKCK